MDKKCLEARDYQGCVASFSGYSAVTKSSDSYQKQLLLEQMLNEQRENARLQRRMELERRLMELDRIERERRYRMADSFKRAMDGIADSYKPRPSLNCTSNSIGSSLYTSCY